MKTRQLLHSRFWTVILVLSLLLSSTAVEMARPGEVAHHCPCHPSGGGYPRLRADPCAGSAGAWYTSWHYFILHDSLEEALRSRNKTTFVIMTNLKFQAGELMDGSSPRYPIVISLASEAVLDAEVNALRSYVSAGGFLFSGSSSFTKQANGTPRGDFALASEMGMHLHFWWPQLALRSAFLQTTRTPLGKRYPER